MIPLAIMIGGCLGLVHKIYDKLSHQLTVYTIPLEPMILRTSTRFVILLCTYRMYIMVYYKILQNGRIRLHIF